ncbi:MAG: BCCT family transporter [Treponema sp.]|jgi:choline-glycine betaine transporter|nr:BCCT family transporter [Treponema sp.]
MKGIRPIVFFPPALLAIAALIYSLVDNAGFSVMASTANNWLLDKFGWLFSLGSLAFLVAVIAVFFSPLAKVKLGGQDAVPILSDYNWFAITLCTTIAIGILFWGTAEPLYHFAGPPRGFGIEPNSPAAVRFAMSTMFMHWTFTPYAIYTLPALMFAFVFYNMHKPFSLGSTLTPILGDRAIGKFGEVIDAVCLYALILGMAASLGTGILSLAGGLSYQYNIPNNTMTYWIIGALIVTTFIISAGTGLMKGIRILSDINTKVLVFIILFVFLFGPTVYILQLGTEGFGEYLTTFFQRSLLTGAAAYQNGEGIDMWGQWWTNFYFANWLAWAPITALFLGRLGYGQTIRKFLLVNFVLPAVFSGIWMAVFSGTALRFELDGKGISGHLEKGPEYTGFAVLGNLPLSAVIIPLFLFICFICFVTAADSNTNAMGGMSTTGVSPESPEPRLPAKIFWGILVGMVSVVMISASGIGGIKTLSNLGGLPALFIELALLIGLVKIMYNPSKYDVNKKDYDSDGKIIPKVTKFIKG